MPTTSTYYLDAETLEAATAVYTDAALTTKATDGWYKEGFVVREQSSGALLPNSDCPQCNEDCDSGIAPAAMLNNAYLADINMGEDTGAIIVTMTPPAASVMGIIAFFDGNMYNGMSSVNYGWVQGCANGPSFIGDTAGDCGIGGVVWGPLTEYELQGGLWALTGNTPSITVLPCQVATSAGATGVCTMVIPKVKSGNQMLNLEFYGVCGGSTANMTVACPVKLTPIDAHLSAESDLGSACATTIDDEFYTVPVNGSAGTIGLYDIVFLDENAQTSVASVYGAGFYKYNDGANRWAQLDANSVVVAFGNCP